MPLEPLRAEDRGLPGPPTPPPFDWRIPLKKAAVHGGISLLATMLTAGSLVLADPGLAATLASKHPSLPFLLPLAQALFAYINNWAKNRDKGGEE